MTAIKPTILDTSIYTRGISFLDYLPMDEVSVDRRVCKQWDALIKSDAFHKGVEKRAVRGELVLLLRFHYIHSYDKDSFMVEPFKWQSNDREPYVEVNAHNYESLLECRQKHSGDQKINCKLDHQGGWSDGYSKVPEFPNRLPLRLLISKFPKEGKACQTMSEVLMPYNSKNSQGRLTIDVIKIMTQYLGLGNNQLHLIIKGRPLILTCIDFNEHCSNDESDLCWQKVLEKHTKDGLFINSIEVNHAKIAAAEHDKKAALAVRYRWIFSG